VRYDLVCVENAVKSILTNLL